MHYDEEDSDVKKYINTRDVEVRKIPLGSDATEVDNLLLDIMRPHLNRLRDTGAIDHRDYAKWNTYDLLRYKSEFTEAPPSHIREVDRDSITKSFVALSSLCHIRKLLVNHGIKQAYDFILDKLEKRSLNLMRKNELFWQLKEKMQLLSSQGSGVKIKELRTVMVEHFSKSDSKDSRVIIFSHFRGSVNEIYCSLQTIDNSLVRPVEFIGQSSAGKRLKGQSQKTQQAILRKFRSGEYNVLVATSIGEEGLDIIEVDLVVCFDANISPLRMIQRMGRTGRKNDGRVVVLACDGDEVKGYEKKQADTKTMKKLLRNSKRFECHASPRMIPHLYKPEVTYVQLKIKKYIPSLKKIKVAVKGTSPVLEMSEEDGRLIAQYYGMEKAVWKPSLVAFPRFQLSPSVAHKVLHSFRTTDMLIDAMQQLQDLSFFRTKCENPVQGSADAATVKGQTHEGTGIEAIPQGCDSVEASSKEEVLDQSFYMPNFQVKTYPIHSFFCGDHVTVDSGGNVTVTFVPVLPRAFVFRKDINNANWCHRLPKMSRSCRLAAEVRSPTVESDRPRYVTDSGKHMLQNSVSNLPLHSHSEQAGNVNNDCGFTSPSKTFTSPKEKWNPYCSAILACSSFSGQDDVEFSPRLKHYIEEGIVPDSPVLDVDHIQVELDGAINDHANAGGCPKEPFGDEKNDHAISSRHILDQTRVQAEEPPGLSNVNICTPTTNTSTNLLCDSFSSDCHLRSGADISVSVQQAPKYRRLCKYGDKMKKLSISLDDFHDGVGDITTVRNRIEHTTGDKEKAKRHLDTYIDEEVEVSHDADVSEDEDDNLSEDKYEDSFIDDQETPTGEFTQTKQGDGNNGDMMGFYRQSLLTQTPVVLPSRYLDASDGSASSGTRNTSSSETRHNSGERVETPKGPCPIHHTMDPSPLWYQQRSMEGASIIQQQTKMTIDNCESSSKMDYRKRKLNFQQPSTIPVINLELEPAPQPSVHLATGASDDVYLDDDFFEGLDLDAIEAQATEQWKQRTAKLTQKPVEPKKASEISFAPPSFDLGF